MTILQGYYISFIYIPTEAILHDTWAIAYLRPNLPVLCIASFLFGMGDVCLFTTGFSLLGKVFRGRTAATAVSVFNFLIMLFTGILFFVSSFISLQVQLLVITITLFCSILGIFAVDNIVNNTETVSSSAQTE